MLPSELYLKMAQLVMALVGMVFGLALLWLILEYGWEWLMDKQAAAADKRRRDREWEAYKRIAQKRGRTIHRYEK